MFPKLMFFDLDFTLLDEKRKISDRTMTALKAAKNAGSFIAFATSRGNTNMENFAELVQPQAIITNGGSCIYYKNNLIHKESFSIKDTKLILKNTFNILGTQAEITIDTQDSLYWNKKENESECYAPDTIFNDMIEFNQEALKICVKTSDRKIANQIAKDIKECDILPFSDIPWHKFSPVNATKGKAVAYLAEYLEIPLEQTVAFGDDFSDISMLKTAGIGVAMKNAIKQVQDAADEIADFHNCDGVAKWIEQRLSKNQ